METLAGGARASPIDKAQAEMMKRTLIVGTMFFLIAPSLANAQKYTDANGRLRIALSKQLFSPNGTSSGPNTMANGGIQEILGRMNAVTRVEEARLTAEENTEYGGWKRLSMALGHFADLVEKNERDGYFTVGLLATCPSMPGLVAGLQRSGPTHEPLRIGMLWLDAHPDINTPETTRSGSLGGMPVAVATGRALQRMRLDAKLEPALSDKHVVMGGVRLTDPLEQSILDDSFIEQLSVDDLRHASPAVFAQLDRLNRLVDKIYVHIDMDVLDPVEVSGHGNKVPNGPSSQQLAALFEQIFRRYPKASAIGFATIPGQDPGGLSLAAVNRMIEGAVKGLQAREGNRPRS
jgi:arginase